VVGPLSSGSTGIGGVSSIGAGAVRNVEEHGAASGGGGGNRGPRELELNSKYKDGPATLLNWLQVLSRPHYEKKRGENQLLGSFN